MLFATMYYRRNIGKKKNTGLNHNQLLMRKNIYIFVEGGGEREVGRKNQAHVQVYGPVGGKRQSKLSTPTEMFINNFSPATPS